MPLRKRCVLCSAYMQLQVQPVGCLPASRRATWDFVSGVLGLLSKIVYVADGI